MTNNKRNILIIRKFTFYGSNEIYTYRNTFCQIEIIVTIIICIYNVKKK
jgi:hypothetical protein